MAVAASTIAARTSGNNKMTGTALAFADENGLFWSQCEMIPFAGGAGTALHNYYSAVVVVS